MTNFEKIKSMSSEEFAKWLNKKNMVDNTPWMNWWETNYCDHCDPLTVKAEDAEALLGLKPFNNEPLLCAYCELHDDCKFFPNREVPSITEIIKMWLEVEYED